MRLFGFLLLVVTIMMNMALANGFVVPVRLAKYISIPIIRLNINGDSTQFMFDSGSQSALHLPLHFLQQLPQATQQANDDLSLDMSGNLTKSSKFMIQHLNINGLDFDNVKAVELKPWGFSYSSDPSVVAPTPEDGLPVIGLTLFKNHILTLDFAHNKLQVDNHNQSVPYDDKWIAVPYRYHVKEGLIIGVTDGNNHYNLVLDSGASVSMIVGKSLPEKYQNSNILTKADHGDAHIRLKKNGAAQTIKIYPDYPLIGKLPVRAVIIDGTPKDFEADGLLGMDFLQKYMVRIDQKNNKLWIKPAK
ncbi:MAG: aspartyl protease family protein [Snodgrassella sp.]|nr:aspartyl protease family protein [Snodgrassella sp.]